MALPTRTELDQLIRDRLAADPAFKAALLADPRATVAGGGMCWDDCAGP